MLVIIFMCCTVYTGLEPAGPEEVSLDEHGDDNNVEEEEEVVGEDIHNHNGRHEDVYAADGYDDDDAELHWNASSSG